MKPLYRTAFSLAQWALGLAALAWALSEVDLGMLCEAVQSYSLAAMMPVFALAIADYTCMGFRLNALMPKGTGLALSMKGCLLCVGMNCLLPAKAGDALKILYLTRNTGQSFVTISSVVIWERLCDVIYLASLLLFAVPNMQADELGVNMVVPAFVLCAGVLGFYTLRHWSGFFHALYARFLPSRIGKSPVPPAFLHGGSGLHSLACPRPCLVRLYLGHVLHVLCVFALHGGHTPYLSADAGGLHHLLFGDRHPIASGRHRPFRGRCGPGIILVWR